MAEHTGKVEMEKPCAVCDSPDHFSERHVVKIGNHKQAILTCPNEPPDEIRMGDQVMTITKGVAADGQGDAE